MIKITLIRSRAVCLEEYAGCFVVVADRLVISSLWLTSHRWMSRCGGGARKNIRYEEVYCTIACVDRNKTSLLLCVVNYSWNLVNISWIYCRSKWFRAIVVCKVIVIQFSRRSTVFCHLSSDLFQRSGGYSFHPIFCHEFYQQMLCFTTDTMKFT